MALPEERQTLLPHWKAVLREQGRAMTWLARNTDRSPFTVHAYSSGAKVPPQTWLDRVSELLGVQVRG